VKLTLHRDFNSDVCTIGRLSFSTPSEDFNCDTMERPWIPMPGAKGGLSGKSCVPKGTYKLERHSSEAHPNTWALVNSDLDVIHYEDRNRPNARCLVLIHVGNYAREIRGCIALGFGRAVDGEGTRMVTNSKRAMIEFKRLLQPYDDSHSLEIR
jgi:hypothetical protein